MCQCLIKPCLFQLHNAAHCKAGCLNVDKQDLGVCVLLQDFAEAWATRRPARLGDRSHLRGRLQHRCAAHHGAAAQRPLHRPEGELIGSSGWERKSIKVSLKFYYLPSLTLPSFIYFVLWFNLTCRPGSYVSGGFIDERQTSDRTGCGGGDPLPAQSRSPAQRHQAQKCSGK